ncbi:hypothetical protein NEF87_003860 [Candidatus Lokiarchaeum ossiferum]|uniref:PhzF family phenazine biosynthesis protein n=1 Tax=Candidatus Lokiarchaeum ossiferum TaxID=2951803 RepID=A0ABY6HVL9_9ARCH|nr:hypothetical protein NEF87_003860 [Candidatus Lokiarchaeum sp. B-35]
MLSISRLKYHIVDVFAQEKFTGNQVVVVECDHRLSVEHMQRIACEMNFPETSFIYTEVQNNGGYDVRIFTPTREVSFSGHPTLGTAFVINHFLNPGIQKEIRLNLTSGTVVINAENLGGKNSNDIISKSKPILTSGQKKPEFGHIFEPVLLSRVLGLDMEEMDQSSPIQAVTIGIGFVIVPVKSLKILKRVKINIERYNWLISRTDAKSILVFCRETENPMNHVHVRVFSDFYGIPEDTATGSGNGALAAYLAKYQCFGSSSVNIRVEQGYEVGRPSLILAQATVEGEDIEVSIGGRVVLIAQGEIL